MEVSRLGDDFSSERGRAQPPHNRCGCAEISNDQLVYQKPAVGIVASEYAEQRRTIYNLAVGGDSAEIRSVQVG